MSDADLLVRVGAAIEGLRCTFLDTALRQWNVVPFFLDDRVGIELIFRAPDSAAPGVTVIQHSREWLLDQDADTAAILRTIFLAAFTAIEHELRETFTFQGKAVCAPHFTVEEVTGV